MPELAGMALLGAGRSSSRLEPIPYAWKTSEATSIAHLTLGVDWSNVLEREHLVVAQSLARLQALQSELALLRTGQFALSDID